MTRTRRFVVVGESLVDLVARPGSWTFDAHPGGSPLNVAVALARLGVPAELVSEVGRDLFGDLLRRHLADSGVGTAAVRTVATTSVAAVRVDEVGQADYDFRFAWELPSSPAPDVAGAAGVHVGSLAALTAPGSGGVLAYVRSAVDAGLAVSYDPNIRPGLVDDRTATIAAVEELADLADIVKASADDLAWLYPDLDPVQALRRWSGGGGLAVLTRGADGAVAVQGDLEVECPAPAVTVADTVGAGDTFTAGLLASLDGQGLLRRGATYPAEALRTALRAAAAAAAVTCSRPGADPPRQAELLAR